MGTREIVVVNFTSQHGAIIIGVLAFSGDSTTASSLQFEQVTKYQSQIMSLWK